MQLDAGIEKGVEGGQGQFDDRQRDQHRDRGEQDRFADELGDQLAARCAEHLAQGHFSRALGSTGGGEVGEVHAGHAQDQQRDYREGQDRATVVARRLRAILRRAEMEIAQVDQGEILEGAGIDLAIAVHLVGDIALLPCRQAGIDRRGIRA